MMMQKFIGDNSATKRKSSITKNDNNNNSMVKS